MSGELPMHFNEISFIVIGAGLTGKGASE